MEGALPTLGWSNVRDVHVGKHIRLTVEADDDASARAQVEEMASRLLSNPVIERLPDPGDRAGRPKGVRP